MKRSLWLGTAVLGLMIGISAPANAQQYLSRFKQSDLPPVEVDMSVLGDSAGTPSTGIAGRSDGTVGAIDQETLPSTTAKPAKTRLANYIYSRNPTYGDNTSDAPEAAPAPQPEAPVTEIKPVKTVAPVAPPEETKKSKTSTKVIDEPAPAKKTGAKKKNKPSLVVVDEPVPPKEVAKTPSAADAKLAAPPMVGIVSQPPPTAEVAAPQPVHRNIATPIISAPPDAPGAPVREDLKAVPALPPQPVHHDPDVPVSSMAPDAPPAQPVHEDLMAKPVAPPAEPSPEPKIEYAPRHHTEATPPHAKAPPVQSAEVAAPPHEEVITPPQTETVVTAPEAAPAEKRPAAMPLPEIKIVHDADNPEVAEPAQIAQPEVKKMPREEPLPLPKSTKIGTTTAPLLVPREDLSETPPADAAPPPASTPAVAAEPAITPPIAAPAPTAAPPDETAAMPVVPTMADLTLGFAGNSSDLTTETQKKLDAVIQQMKDMADGRLQVRGYASGEDGSKSSARRIALSRALSVRSYLMDKGIKPTRVDVRALGTETERSPLDRVDLVFVR